MSISLELFEESEKKEKCGLFGIWGTPESSQIVYQGIFAQQHRGQESAGIAVTTGSDLNGHTGMGLVSQVFNPRMLKEESGGQRGHRACAVFHHGVQQVVQRPAAVAAILAGAGGGGS